MKTKSLAVPYNGSEFFMKVADGEMVNLTDVWRGAGEPEDQNPHQWLRLPSTVKFIEEIQTHPIVGKSPNWNQAELQVFPPLLKTVRGRYGGTYAHWRLGVEYAAYLSPKLRILITDIFRERLEETVDPELGFTRSRKRAVKLWLDRGQTQAWIAVRIEGIDKRNEFTSVQSYDLPTPWSYPLPERVLLLEAT